jgi:hypothetical protein
METDCLLQWHSIIDQKSDKNWEDRNDEGKSKTILESIGTDLNFLTPQSSWYLFHKKGLI